MGIVMRLWSSYDGEEDHLNIFLLSYLCEGEGGHVDMNVSAQWDDNCGDTVSSTCDLWSEMYICDCSLHAGALYWELIPMFV